MNPDKSDEELARDAGSNGDSDALKELVRRYNDRLLQYFQTAVKNEYMTGGDWEDMAQEAWLTVSRNIIRFDSRKASFAGWLFGVIAKTRWIDAQRRWRRSRQFLPIDTVEDSQAENKNGDDALRIEEDEMIENQRIALAHCLSTLSEDEKKIADCWLMNKKNREIAEILTVDYDNSLRARIDRVKTKVKSCAQRFLSSK